MATAPTTVTDALQLLADEGYTDDFNLLGQSAECPTCRSTHPLEHSIIERQYRFEGPTDPGDEAIVLGLSCPSCHAKGVFVSAYGPDADPELFEVLSRLPRVDS